MSDTFGDIGSSSDLSDFFDSGSSGGGADLSGVFNNLDPNAFNGAGGTDLGSLASAAMGGMGSLFGGGGNPVQQANSASAIDQVADPANVAQTAIAGGQPAPSNTQNQNAQGGGGQSGQGQGQFAPQSAVDQLKKALQGLKQQQRQNPYQTGGGAGAAAAGQNSPMLNRAGRIPTGQVPPAPAQPAQDPLGSSVTAAPMQTQGQGGFDPTAVLGDEGPVPGDPTPKPPWFKWAGGRPFQPATPQDPNQVTDIPDFRRNPAAAQAGQGAVEGATAPAPEPPSLPPNLGGGPSAAGTLAGLARSIFPSLPSSLLGAAGTYFGNVSPAETGELTPGQRGINYRPEDDPQARPPYSGHGPGRSPTGPSGVTDQTSHNTPIAKAPETGKPVKTVDPKTNKPVDPKTGAPLPTHKRKDENLPTHTGYAPPPQGGPSPMQQDMTGGQGIPSVLGDLARIALPLILQGLMGGFGGGRHGGFGIGRRWGHPFGFGGRNMGAGFGGRRGWPFYHPTFGWQIHGQHPGRGWLPMDPRHMRQFMGGGGGGGPLGYAEDDGQDGDGGGNAPAYDSGRPGAGADASFKSSGLGSNPFINSLVGQESYGGQNVISRTDRDSHGRTLAQGGNPDEISQGYFQIQNYPGGTWQTYGRQAGIDLARYPTPRSAPLAVQWKVAQLIPIGQWGGATKALLQRRGFSFNPNTPMGKVASTFGNTQIAGDAPTKTETGGSNAPNPKGNNSDLAGKEPETASAE